MSTRILRQLLCALAIALSVGAADAQPGGTVQFPVTLSSKDWTALTLANARLGLAARAPVGHRRLLVAPRLPSRPLGRM
jgi:hypothetical protein